MKLVPSAALLILSVATIAAGTVAWQQYQRAERLERALAAAPVRPDTPAPAPAAPSPLPAETTEDPEAAAVATAAAGDSAVEAARMRGGRGDPGARFNAMMENPEFAAAWQAQQKARLDDRYAALFRRLNLSPTQIEQLKSLLVDRQASRMDVLAAARSEGLAGRDSRGEIAELMEQTMGEIDQGIRALLGEPAYAQFEQYERTTPQRNVVSQLETRLSYSSTPLTTAQSDALVRILAETGGVPGRSPNFVIGSPGGGGGGGGASPAVAITDATIARAQGVLTPSQLESLRQVQAEQEAQRQLSELMRQQFQRDRPTPPPGG